MALFKSEEQKAAKTAAKEQKLLERYGLENLGDSKDVQSVKKIIDELSGTGLMEAGLKLSFKSPTEQKLQVMYQRVLMEQNFIIIRQLDKISKLLEDK